MTNSVVPITGTLTGIGHAIARAFAGAGARVVVAGRREDAGRQVAADLQALGAEVEFTRADVRHEDEVRVPVDRTVERLSRLDVAVNCAGTEGKPRLVTERKADTYGTTLDTK